jgi:hypothetical protein
LILDSNATKNKHKSYQGDENMSDYRREFNGNGDRSRSKMNGAVEAANKNIKKIIQKMVVT